jgi:hypothetical protein
MAIANIDPAFSVRITIYNNHAKIYQNGKCFIVPVHVADILHAALCKAADHIEGEAA